MSIHKAIDQIVETFIPEMERISKMNESEEQKERHYKAWLRATLQKFADDVRDIEKRNTAERRDNDAACGVLGTIRGIAAAIGTRSAGNTSIDAPQGGVRSRLMLEHVGAPVQSLHSRGNRRCPTTFPWHDWSDNSRATAYSSGLRPRSVATGVS